MTLRNAFDGLATEGTLGKIIAILQGLQRNTNYARDVQDRLRVTVDNSVNASVSNGANNSATMQGGGLNPLHWGTNSWNLADDRWEFGNALNGVFNSTRNRWTF